jgi:type I restriction enzyme M protein
VLTTINFARVAYRDRERQDRILGHLIEGVSRISMTHDDVKAGDVYDALVSQFAENNAKASGEIFLSAPIAHLMAELLDLQNGTILCDPFCRAGRALVECAKIASREQIKIEAHGQDPKEQLCAICKMNLFLHGIRDARVEAGNVLYSPKLTRNGKLLCYDRVLTAPPIRRDNWGAEELAADPFGRFPILPPKNNADYAYILHCLAILKDGGRAVILTGRGVLFRQGSEGAIRRTLIQQGHVEVVISLPGGLLYGTHIPAALLVLRKGDPLKHNKVLFIEAQSAGAQRSRAQAIGQDQIEAIVRCAHRFADIEGFSRVVDFGEIEQNQWNLNPDQYIARDLPTGNINFDEMIDGIHQLENDRDEAVSMVDALMSELRNEFEL